jgi:hypothetical protein
VEESDLASHGGFGGAARIIARCCNKNEASRHS